MYLKEKNKIKEYLKQNGLNITVTEFNKIKSFIKREPSLTELHIFNAEWSEHCSYKSSKKILKKYLPTKAPWVILGPQEDAGIISLKDFTGDSSCLVVAHESHNHPSQVLPVEGAATGVGGIVRDVDCMGAKVIGVMDILRFGNPYGKSGEKVKAIVNGVVEGIWTYSNALGVPNLGGDTFFNDCYDDNCLVNVFAVGIVEEEKIIRSFVPKQAANEKYVLILIGKPTDNSGFGGAAFASEIMDEEQEKRGAVQIPDPFIKNVLLFKANQDLYKFCFQNKIKIGFKDLGAAGIACAGSELTSAGGFGAKIYLDKVPVSIKNLPPEVIAVAETQERYLLAAPQKYANKILNIYNKIWNMGSLYQNAGAAVIGEVTSKKDFVLFYKGEKINNIVCNLPIDKVTEGILIDRKAKKEIKKFIEKKHIIPKDLNKVLLKLLSSLNLCSKEYLYRFYDTEVQGNSIMRAGEANAVVIAPFKNNQVGLLFASGGNHLYGKLSPYWVGAHSVAESIRNIVATGGTPLCLTDCLNFGNPEKESAFYDFQESVKGIADAANEMSVFEKYPVPIVSGNVSFYNESKTGSEILPSPVVCCSGAIKNYNNALTCGFTSGKSLICFIGERKNELGASAYYETIFNCLNGEVPKLDFNFERNAIKSILELSEKKLILSCNDIAGGGLLITIAEMFLKRNIERLGCELNINNTNNLTVDKFLFTETPGYVFEVSEENHKQIASIFYKNKITLNIIGKTNSSNIFTTNYQNKKIINLTFKEMQNSFVKTLKELWD